MNKGPDYSGAFIILHTNQPKLNAYGRVSQWSRQLTIGMTFTSGSGNEVVCLAMETLARRIQGKSLADLTENMAITYRDLVSGQIRWIGPEVSTKLSDNGFAFGPLTNTLYLERRCSHGHRCGHQCDLGLVGKI